MSLDIASIRQEYLLASLHEDQVQKDALIQFQTWFQEAVSAAIDDVNAMTLSTVSAEGKPHARIVLLKGVETQSLVFYTNYNSHKGQHIEGNAHVSLVFYWKELQRQVRIEGIATKVSEEESTTYFHSRPRESQLGAWASYQSEPLIQRNDLVKRYEALQTQYEQYEIPRPPHWGGYAVKPTNIEFWQGRASRLHDRILYTLQKDSSWLIERLNP